AQRAQVIAAQRVDPVPMFGNSTRLVVQRIEVAAEGRRDMGSAGLELFAPCRGDRIRTPEAERTRRARQHQLGEAQVVRAGATKRRVHDRERNAGRWHPHHPWSTTQRRFRSLGGNASSEAVASASSERLGLYAGSSSSSGAQRFRINATSRLKRAIFAGVSSAPRDADSWW